MAQPSARDRGGAIDPRTDAPNLAGCTLLAIFAHPDDESLACGGTLARAADAGATIVLLCATRGERGSISDPALVPDGDLGRVRTGELQEAAAVLGIANVTVLDHPDGDLRWADVPELHDDIVDAIRRWHPDAIVTFDEDGLYWHLDHVAVHERTVAAVQSLDADAPPVYFVTMPKDAMRGLAAAAHAKGGCPPESAFWGIAPEAFGYDAAAPTVIVDVRPWIQRKLAALRCHRTQMAGENPISWIDEADAAQWLGLERFRRAPSPSTASDILEQLGESRKSSNF